MAIDVQHHQRCVFPPTGKIESVLVGEMAGELLSGNAAQPITFVEEELHHLLVGIAMDDVFRPSVAVIEGAGVLFDPGADPVEAFLRVFR